jgi:phospholipid/cholesterol/gamma-HCH transport system ATP-binding protein
VKDPALDDLPPIGALSEARALRKSFGARQVLDGVDLSVCEGEISVVLGGSGSGKSTLLRCLMGLEQPDGGTVRLLGKDLDACSPDTRMRLMLRTGMLFQFGALFDSMTVEQNVAFALRHVLKRPEDEIAHKVREKLLMVGLKDVGDLYPSQLSGGMRKRVALARAIAHQPKILFVDEPTTGLDPIMSDTIHQLILQLRDRLGMTVFCITLDLRAAFFLADRIAMLYRGRIISSGTPDEMRRETNPVVRQFVTASTHGPVLP